MKLTNTGSAVISTLTPKATICVHGNIVQPEYPEKIEEVSRKGWGTTFWGKEDTSNWFHIPVVQPILVEGERRKLVRVFVYFHNTSRSPITAVHVYDGPRLIKAFDNLKLSGDHGRAMDRSNTFLIDPPADVNFGLGISVNVQFPVATEQKPPRWILFTTAGAEFRA